MALPRTAAKLWPADVDTRRATATSPPRPRLALVLLMFQLLTACAGPRRGEGIRSLGAGHSLPAARDGVGGAGEEEDGQQPELARLGEVTREEQVAEWSRAVAEMDRVVDGMGERGTEVGFRYWVEQGALTLDGWELTTPGGEAGARVEPESFARGFRRMPAELQGQPAFVHFLLRRESGRWELRASRRETAAMAPPEAKHLPAKVPDLPAAAFEELRRAVRPWVSQLRVSGDESARFDFRVDFFDGRRTQSGLKARSTPDNGRSRPIEVPEELDTRLAGALIPFAQGIGAASVVVHVQPYRRTGESHLVWRVTSAQVLRPDRGEPDGFFTRFTDYRLMHEEFIRRSRAETRDAAELVARFTGEQVAWWVVGGIAVRGMGAALGLSGGTMAKVLGRGGAAAAGWLESMLVRMPATERDAATRLWLKVETEGLEALSAGERGELQAFFQRLNELAKSRITEDGAKATRVLSRIRLWKDLWKQNPELARQLLGAAVHHRWPIEYAHLAPELDINALTELVALSVDAHAGISDVWTSVRPYKSHLTASDIREVIVIIERHFQRWYNVPEKAVSKVETIAAKKVAIQEVERLLSAVRVR